MSLFVSNVMAATPGATAAGSDGMFSMIMMAAIFVLFYFMLIRPQSKRAKDHKALISNLKKGDEVITTGGMLGKVASLDEQFVKVTVGENMEITLQRHAISSILPKGTLKSI